MKLVLFACLLGAALGCEWLTVAECAAIVAECAAECCFGECVEDPLCPRCFGDMALKCIPCIERIDDAGESDSDSCFMSNTRSSGSVIQQVTYTGREDCVELCLSESRCEGIVISPLVWRVTTCYIIGEHTTSAYWGWQYADRSCFESEPGECSPKSLGCWTDLPTRAIAGGIRFNSDTPIEDCFNLAMEQGFSVFAVQANRECFTSADAAETFNQYGLSAACQYDGRGGTWAQNVYQVTCEE